MAKRGTLLIVDDNRNILSAVKLLADGSFAKVVTLSSPTTLLSTVAAERPNVLLLDMNFHAGINTGNEGIYWLKEVCGKFPDVKVVLFTAYGDIDLAVKAMKHGAFDFVVKPWNNDKLMETLLNALEQSMGKGKKKQEVPVRKEVPMFWGGSAEMEHIRTLVERVAVTDANVLINGENGTGKELLAREIHRLSKRCGKEMVSLDMGAIPETLFESELFGHVKGAFTDAHIDHVGKFEQANGGTLFLDEIGNIPPHLQGKLLRVLQNRCITRVGDDKAIPVDIRLICATNKDLKQMVANGRFRQDLYYRINTFELHLPALRERTDEIGPLAEMFITKFAERYRRNVKGLSEEATERLKSHFWSGNIRELSNCIEKAVILSENELLTAADIEIVPARASGPAEVSGTDTLEETEEKAIRAAMARFGGNLSMVAKSLEISRPTLYAKLKEYNI